MSDQILRAKGLYTSANQLSAVPEGALETAKNIDVLSQDIAQPRRGFELANATQYSTGTDRTDALFFYQDKMIMHHGTYLSANTLSYYDSGLNTIGTYSAPASNRIRFLEASQNVYFTTSAGITKLDSISSTPEAAGAPKALNMTLALTGASGWFEGETNPQVVAYRCVWAKYDTNNNLVVGAPSGRELLTNSLGAGNDRNTAITIWLPADVTTSHFVQIYRSVVVDSPAATPVEPNDELRLVYEAFPTSADITNGYMAAITDITAEALRGAALYTNATQEGLAAQNERPPLAEDIAEFRESAFYSNTLSAHRYFLTLLGTTAMANDDTISIGGITYTAKASETAASGFFKLFTAGTASQNIADTARSLVSIVNQYSSSTVYGYYLSSGTDLPGKMLFEERGIGGAAFVVKASASSYWSPSGIPSSGTTEISENDDFANQIMWSKPLQPEHVPLVNTARVGSANYAILRIVPLKDSLIIFKQDGIFRLTGYYPSFTVERIDSSAKLIGRETPRIVNNEIYCLTDLGIVKVSDSVQIISIDINQDLIQLINRYSTTVETMALGQGYETDKKYYLWVPNSTTDANPTFAYVYNILTQSFTTHTTAATAAVVYDKTLHYSKGATTQVLKERKNYSYLDYADYGFTTSISAISSLTFTMASDTDNMAAGDIIYQSETLWGTIQSVDTVAGTVVLDRDPGLTVAACTILQAIDTEITWVLMTAPSPGTNKQYYSSNLFFQEAFNGIGTIGFSTDISPGVQEVSLTGLANGAWAVATWASQLWGSAPFARSWRQWVPRSKQRCSQMTVTFKHKWSYSPYKLTGVSLLAKQGSDRTRRD